MVLVDNARPLADREPSIGPRTCMPDRIYAALKHRILTCGMRPGQRIVEKDVCADLHVSRTPLREALNRLALEGLVVVTPYRGYAVAPLTVESYRELCELRRIVEGETAALAARRATEEELEVIAALSPLQYTRGDLDSYNTYIRTDFAFHSAVARCTKNQQLVGIVTSAIERRARPGFLGLDIGINADEAAAEHVAIVEAVRMHDSELARARMIAHITRAEGRIVSALKTAGY
jgi:GntR family transcriptional regulator, rspAB operon transcriptional repressor